MLFFKKKHTVTLFIYAAISLALISHSHNIICKNNNNTNKKFACDSSSVVSVAPDTITELQQIVSPAKKDSKKIAIIGAGKSQGGQTICSGALDSYQISLDKLNNLVSLNLADKKVTVQAGMTWKQLQEHIAPHKLSVKAMQSYHDFSIGGSLSVNVHGQDLQNNPLIKTVTSFKLLQANGKIITVNRNENKELFELALGGYGLFGIIVEVTLQLTDDILMERKTVEIESQYLSNYFYNSIKNDPDIEFYSARLSLGESDLLDKALIVSYKKTNIMNKKAFTIESETTGRKLLNSFLRSVGLFLRESQALKNWRFELEKKYFMRSKLISRNNFMSYSIESLPQDDQNNAYILQEYFIPYSYVNSFIDYLRDIIREYNINMLNVTIRHVNKDTESMLAYSPEESCAFVLYIHIPKNTCAYNTTTAWTKQLIDKAIELQGTYYLPYHLIATQKQLKAAYPQFNKFTQLKKQYDPNELFVNELYRKYAVS